MRLARNGGLAVLPPREAPCEGNGELGGAGDGAFPIEVYGRSKSARQTGPPNDGGQRSLAQFAIACD